MKLLKFESYADYVASQAATNKKKIAKVWVKDAELYSIARYIQKAIPKASFGICHGVRNGYEVYRLRELLGIDIIGTEISDTATHFPHVIQWDFHEVKSEWIGACDFIYSNSWDHSYDPVLLFTRWMSCIKPSGRLIIQWTSCHSDAGVDGADCFGASLPEIKGLLSETYEVEAEVLIKERIRLPIKKLLRNVLSKGRTGIKGKEVVNLVVRHKRQA